MEELYHHGIKGQKWGIRRYQRLDGTLTPEGKERYGGNIENAKSGFVRRQLARQAMFGKQENYRKAEKELNKKISEINKKHADLDKAKRETFRRVDRFIALNNNEDKLLKALIKDIGYDDTESGAKWLKSQKWYKKDIGTGLMYAYGYGYDMGYPLSTATSLAPVVIRSR